MKPSWLLALACLAIVVGCGTSGSAGASTLASPGVSDETEASTYCLRTGGAVVVRIPEFGTNGNPLVLANPRRFCEYTARNGSQIDVLGSTLYAVKPTLAALAYYAKVKPGSCEGNPASCYCSYLGGSDLFGGINAAGGGWVGSSGNVLEACIFPDESSIDSFGLFYHSAGIVRGANLAKVLRYRM
jgi:hypothetical protein